MALPKPKLKLPSGLAGGLQKLSYRQLLMLSAVVALLCGALVLFLLPGGGEEQQAEDEAAAPARVKVVVAKQDIQPRTLLKETMLEVIEVPPDILPEGAVTDMVAVVDRPASVPIQKGDILTDKKVLVDPRMAGFTGLIPENCRAMSVPITDVTGIAGFARPGDYVDVMVVSKGDSKIEGEIVLQNILLLGINKTGGDGTQTADASKDDKDEKDKKDDKDKKDEKEKDAPNASDVQASSEAMATATLAVTPDDALKLAVASQKGTVYLVLRPFHPKDVFTVNTDYFLLTGKGQPAAQSAPAPAASAPAPSNPTTVPSARSYSAEPAASAPVSAPVETGSGVEVFRGTTSSVE